MNAAIAWKIAIGLTLIPMPLLAFAMAMYVIHIITNQGPGSDPSYANQVPWHFIYPMAISIAAIAISPVLALYAYYTSRRAPPQANSGRP